MKKRIEVWLHAKNASWSNPGDTAVFDFKFEGGPGWYTPICSAEVEFDIPDDFNPIAAKVTSLEKKIDVMTAKHHVAVRQIKDQIATLQCLENHAVAA